MQLWDYDFERAMPYANEAEAFQHLEKHVEHYKPPECLSLLEVGLSTLYLYMQFQLDSQVGEGQASEPCAKAFGTNTGFSIICE